MTTWAKKHEPSFRTRQAFRSIAAFRCGGVERVRRLPGVPVFLGIEA